jgi:hypothetical protein
MPSKRPATENLEAKSKKKARVLNQNISKVADSKIPIAENELEVTMKGWLDRIISKKSYSKRMIGDLGDGFHMPIESSKKSALTWHKFIAEVSLV